MIRTEFSRFFLLTTFLCSAFIYFSSCSEALSSNDAPPPTLPTVTIIAAPEDRTTGKSTLTQELIQRLPEGNGSVNELLQILPGVQLGEKAHSSLQAGEILPPNISISGGKPFQNNFTIDGIGNNSLLDPMFAEPEVVNDLPGHPQKFFIDSSLIQEVQVLDSNIPARYGDFTGGVVDAQIRNPALDPHLRVGYRTTRNQWTQFHLDREDVAAFEDSREAESQPRFKKHDFIASLDVPYSRKGGILASFTTLQSKIPLRHLEGTRNQSRRQENYLLKVRHHISPADTISLQAMASPTRDERFIKDVKNSEYTIERENYLFAATLNHSFTWGEAQFDAAFSSARTRRDAPPLFFQWKSDTPSRDWGGLLGITYSEEGGVGPAEQGEEGVQLKVDILSTPIAVGSMEHRFNAGLDYENLQGYFERKEDAAFHIAPIKADGIICGDDDIACAEGEQYLLLRNVWEEGTSKARIALYAIYAEDLIRYRRLELRSGLRLSYDDYMHNANLAPRLAAAFDVFGDGRTVLIAGLNRYYGRNLLSDKINEGKKLKRQDRRKIPFVVDNQPNAWDIGYKTTTTSNSFAELKTPYADEVSLGLEQRLLGGRLGLQYLERNWNDEIARTFTKKEEDGKSLFIYTHNNNGSSRHRSYRCTWEGRWARHYLAFNVSRQETTTSSESYEDFFYFGPEETVLVDGHLINRDDLPREDFNRTWVGNLTYSISLPYGFTFTNLTKYRSGYEWLDKLDPSERPVDLDPEIAAYRTERRPESWMFDWQISWQRTLARKHGLLLTLEITNVFNKKVPVGAEAEEGEMAEYELGRQFWAGAEISF